MPLPEFVRVRVKSSKRTLSTRYPDPELHDVLKGEPAIDRNGIALPPAGGSARKTTAAPSRRRSKKTTAKKATATKTAAASPPKEPSS